MTSMVAPVAIHDIEESSYEVVVVGGGPVGLATAVDLGGRGVRVLVVDQGDGAIDYPTAESIDVRSMEWLRQQGISTAVDASGFPADYPRDISFVTRLSTHELARFSRPANRDRLSTTAGLSPEGAVWWPKFWFDTALRDRAAALSTVSVRYGWQCTHNEQTDEQVTLSLVRSDGLQRRVSADYVVACDGARSNIRRALGITMDGQPGEALWQGVFAAIPELLDSVPSGAAAQYYALRPRRAIFGSLNGKDLWRITYPLSPGETHQEEDVVATIRGCIGLPDISMTVIDSRTWSGRTVVASAYREGRIFLAGDAAHQMWPSGGHGMNTGIGDVHNLGWKIAMVLGGAAGKSLLDSYEIERRPVAQRNTARAQSNYGADIALSTDALLDGVGEAAAAARAIAAEAVVQTRTSEWSSLGIQLGYRYAGSPVIVPNHQSHPDDDPSTYLPVGLPGHRAPHVDLPDGRSILDLYGRNFVLVVAADGAETDRWAAAFADLGVPLDVIDGLASFVSTRYSAPLTLVRPDGFIAWAGTNVADAGVCARIVLGREGAQ